jgi:excinuclease ABC subunit C
VRDEAHRFAITYHRQLRGKGMTKSALEGIAGLGPGRRTRLLRHYGTLKALRAASLDELLALPWLPDAVARAAYDHLHTVAPGRATPARSDVGRDHRPAAAVAAAPATPTDDPREEMPESLDYADQ